MAMRGLETTQGFAMKGFEKSSNLAMQGFTMASTRLMPLVQPVATRAVEYLPTPAQTFIHENVEGKSLEQLRDSALFATRKNLLSVKDEDKPATLTGLVGEVKDATMSGDLLKNALSLSEKAANTAFGETEIPKDTNAFRRLYNLAAKVTGGVRTYTTTQMSNLNQQMMNMTSSRVNQMRGMAMQRMDQVKTTMTPVFERIGATPLIPGFVFRLLRGQASPAQEMGLDTSKMMPSSSSATTKEEGSSMGMKEKQTTTTTVPTTTIKVDIVGTGQNL